MEPSETVEKDINKDQENSKLEIKEQNNFDENDQKLNDEAQREASLVRFWAFGEVSI